MFQQDYHSNTNKKRQILVMKKILSCASLFLCLMLDQSASTQTWIGVSYKLSEKKDGKKPILKSIRLSSKLSLEYVEQGDSLGTPVLFLHGYSDSWHSYESVLPLLPNNIHAFVISQRGHGNSSCPSKGYTMTHFANDIASFVEKLKLGPVIIVGHSMGGTVAQRFVIDHPELVKGFVLVGSFANYNNEVIAELYKDVLKLTDPVDRSFVTEFQKSCIAKPIPEKSFNIYVNESLKLPARIWKSVLTELLPVDYTTELKKINKPALILWGDSDAIVHQKDQDMLVKAIQNSRLVVYKGVGHSMQWEEPGRFAKDLVEFIDSINNP